MTLAKYKLDYLELDSAKSKHTRFFFHKKWIGNPTKLSKDKARQIKIDLYRYVHQPFVLLVILRLVSGK